MQRFTREFQLMALAAAVTLAGCATEPPKCGDAATVELVKQIIVDHFRAGDAKGFNAADVAAQLEVLAPRAVGYAEKIRRWSCRATVRSSNGSGMALTYDSQIDDSGKHIVSVGEIDTADMLDVLYGVVTETEKQVWRRRHQSPFIGQDFEELYKSSRWHMFFAYTENAGELRDRLRNGPPLREEDGWLIGEGAIKGNEGRDEAIFAFDPEKRELFYVIRVDGSTFKLYDSKNLSDFPPPLQRWVRERQGH